MNRTALPRVVLLCPPTRAAGRRDLIRRVRGIEPPHGLACMAAVLEQRGASVSLVDADSRALSVPETVEAVSRLKPDVVGITVMAATLTSAASVARELARGPHRPRILLGGPQASALPEQVARQIPDAEALFIGEADLTLPAYLSGALDGEDLQRLTPGHAVVVGRGTPPQLDSLPLPAYHLLGRLEQDYRLSLLDEVRRPSGSLLLARGCPFSCKFCDRTVTGRRYRKLSPGRALELITGVVEEYRLKHVFFHDDTFFVDREIEGPLLSQLAAARLDLTFGCHIHPHLVPPDPLLRLLHDAGCRMVQMGIESGSSRVLARIGKRMNLDAAAANVRRLRDHGIEVKGLFMVGCPGESTATIAETIRFIQRTPFSSIGLHRFTPYPGTPIAQEMARHGELLTRDMSRYDLSQVTFVPSGMTRAEVGRAFYRILGAHFLHPRRVVHVLNRAWRSGRLRSLGQALEIWVRASLAGGARARDGGFK